MCFLGSLSWIAMDSFQVTHYEAQYEAHTSGPRHIQHRDIQQKARLTTVEQDKSLNLS
jgi:hypothetical protein